MLSDMTSDGDGITYSAKKVTLSMCIRNIALASVFAMFTMFRESEDLEHQIPPFAKLVICCAIVILFFLAALLEVMVNNNRQKLTLTKTHAIFYDTWGKERGKLLWNNIIRLTPIDSTSFWLVTEKDHLSINTVAFAEIHAFLKDLKSRLPEGIDIPKNILNFTSNPLRDKRDTFWK